MRGAEVIGAVLLSGSLLLPLPSVAQPASSPAAAAPTPDTGRKLGNVLITPEWKVMTIDFTRAFRLQTGLTYTADLAKVDRALLPRMEALTTGGVKQAVRDYLTASEIEVVMKRRDAIVAHFRKLVADLGPNRVLY